MVLSVLDLKRLLTAVSVQILIQSKCASCLFFTNFHVEGLKILFLSRAIDNLSTAAVWRSSLLLVPTD